jgi:hypothetical protein
MFMGVVHLFSKKIIENNKEFFRKFTSVRAELEIILVTKKDLIANVLQKHISRNRVGMFSDLLGQLVNDLLEGESVSDERIVKITKLEGKIVLGETVKSVSEFSQDVKSKVFIYKALGSAMKCPICGGYLDPLKSMSNDHIDRKEDGGMGGEDNLQFTHPYCNQAVKN